MIHFAKKHLFNVIPTVLIFAATQVFAQPDIRQTDSTLTVRPAHSAQQVRLQMVTDRIIRVSITADAEFPSDSSLIVLPRTTAPSFRVLQEDTTVALITHALQAQVNLNNGAVSFLDSKGVSILQEQADARILSPIEVENTQAYTIGCSFYSPEKEGLYGLGQHQADEFNYKGLNEELFQYNTKVSVPFIISSRNYGLLWDSYSLSRFGDARDYAQLHHIFRLYDKDGNLGGLTGTYTHTKQATLVRTEDSIYFENLKTLRNLPQDFPLAGAKVIYEGELEPDETGDFRFLLYYAGYIKVYADGKLIVPERWRTAWNPNSHKFTLHMQAKHRTHLRIEWQPDGGESYCGLHVLSPRPETKQQQLAFWSEMNPQIDYYFIIGDNMDEVISGYRHLTGQAPMMPRRAMGYWQSRERYKTQKELLDALNGFRTRRLPIDNIVLDWSYWPENAWGSHEFDFTRFPNPKAMIDSVHAMHADFMISVWPKFYQSTTHFKEFDNRGWMYRQAIRDSLRDWIGSGYIGSFYDAYSSGARKLFWKQLHEHLYPLGIDAWWMDASEPNIRDCTDMEYRKALCGPTALGPSTQYFNAYALMNAHAIYNGLREANPNRRVFQLTRSGFAGLQRYATATWSGDIASRWEDLKAQISAGLNFSLSGIPFWSMDIGGFCVENRYVKAWKEFHRTGHESNDLDEWRELNTRWFQFGAFAPLFRSHGQYPPREPWNIAPENHKTYRSMEYYLNLRYRLLPYIYSIAGATTFNDYTPMRALVMDCGSDTAVFSISDQYMFGPSLMVCPVYTYGSRNRKVYLPATSGWYDFYTGKYLAGGQTIEAEAPYERIPLFIPEGAILPTGPSLQYTDESSPTDTLTLTIYCGRDGHFTLYEDDGKTYAYECGERLQIPVTYHEKSSTITIDSQIGSYPEAPGQRTFRIQTVNTDGTTSKAKIVKYKGKKIKIKM